MLLNAVIYCDFADFYYDFLTAPNYENSHTKCNLNQHFLHVHKFKN